VPDSFEEYVTAQGEALLRFAYLVSGDHHLAQDLVQEVLARMHGRWRRVERDGSPGPYVRRAVVREYLSWRRRRSSTERMMAAPPDQPTTHAPPDRVAEQDEAWRLLATLPRAQRAVLVLRFYEDLSDAQIAEVLGCAESTVRVHASRALSRLRTVPPDQRLTGVDR
jgi:RNA polymerase sigma-70 factor (sigma-E family)